MAKLSSTGWFTLLQRIWMRPSQTKFKRALWSDACSQRCPKVVFSLGSQVRELANLSWFDRDPCACNCLDLITRMFQNVPDRVSVQNLESVTLWGPHFYSVLWCFLTEVMMSNAYAASMWLALARAIQPLQKGYFLRRVGVIPFKVSYKCVDMYVNSSSGATSVVTCRTRGVARWSWEDRHQGRFRSLSLVQSCVPNESAKMPDARVVTDPSLMMFGDEFCINL